MILMRGGEKTVLVTLDKETVAYCKALAWERKKFKEWGDKVPEDKKMYPQGILNNAKDIFKTERIGMYGEKAFSIFTGLPLDETISEKGDPGYDFLLNSSEKIIKLDVKNQVSDDFTMNKNSYGEFYVRTDRIRRSDAYFFTTTFEHNGTIVNKYGDRSEVDATKIEVRLYGFITKEDILKNKEERIRPCRKKSGDWKNYEVKKSELISPLDFMWQNQYNLNFQDAGLFL
jgi:hypothetical protein